MLGTKDIITVMMEIEQIKKKISKLSTCDRKKATRFFYIAMMTIFVIIAILLIDIMHNNNVEYRESINNESVTNIKFVELYDENICKFVSDYFKARHDLNFPKIFKCYGRDYYKEIRDKDETKTIIETIKYEKTFVIDYENIKVYSAPGYKTNDILALVTYDMLFGFSEERAPMIIMFYLEKKDDAYIIRDKFDIGTSKYIMDCMNTKQVIELYESVKTNLTRTLAGNENLKLVYNSLRQFEMNMNGNFDNNTKTNILENIGYTKYDPVKDAAEINDRIIDEKTNEKNKKIIDSFVSKIVDSMNKKK